MTNVAGSDNSGLATFVNFVGVSFKSMVTILSITVMIAALSMAVFQIFYNYTKKRDDDIRTKVMPHILGVAAIMFASGAAPDSGQVFILIFELTLAVAAMGVPVLSMIPDSRIHICTRIVTVAMLLVAVFHIVCASGISHPLHDEVYMALSGMVSVSSSLFFMYMIWRRIRDVKSVIKSGNVWSFLTLCVDVIYVSVPLLINLMLHSFSAMFSGNGRMAYVMMVLLFLEMVAMGMKVIFDSAFVLMHNHERIIVESMKISRMDAGVGNELKGEERYKELYERIEHYFETTRPYLDGDLTINDVVKVVYSNKVYISQAICHYTGRNFRQFVNYHRVIYSMDLFRNNLEFKVADLAEKSGFNNMVSYTMAFRLFMNETPSEWCRKERAKILKPKK